MEKFPLILGNIRDLESSQISFLFTRADYWWKNKSGVIADNFPRKPVVMTLFLEKSTRTKLSFAQAALHLGLHYLDFPVEESSLKKGEDLNETLATLHHQGVDLVVIRTSDAEMVNGWRMLPPNRIINGGNGMDEHPTQALLDFFTFKHDGLPVEGSTLAIIGDVRHSRVANSLIALAPFFKVNIVLNGPLQFKPNTLPKGVSWVNNLEEALTSCQRIYLLRVQKERHQNSGLPQENYLEQHGLSLLKYQKLKLSAPVYHPGPCNIGTELDLALLQSPHYGAYRQVNMSIPMRQAILECMLIYGHNLNTNSFK